MSDPARLSLQVSADALAEFRQTAAAVGLRHTPLYSLAMTLGMRVLARQLNPDAFPPSDLAVLAPAHYEELMSILSEIPNAKKK